MMRHCFVLVFLIFFSLYLCSYGQEKPKLIVLTDIGGDPDDMQSLRRLLVYSNAFQIKGLIATSDNIPRPNYQHKINTHLILEAIDDYAKVRDNLLLHEPGFPTAESLRAVVHGGQVDRGAGNLAPGRETPGSRHIIETVDKEKGPVYIVIWGGAHDLAQALLDMRTTRTKKEISKFIGKIRVYAIADQDKLGDIHPLGTGEWIRQNFTELLYIEPGSSNIHIMSASFRGMYQNDSRGGNYAELPLVKPGLETLNGEKWIVENVNAWGPLGAGYPANVGQNPGSPRNTRGVKEGDTPSWFFHYSNGLSNPKQPGWGGWGGRFVKNSEFYYTEAEDDHWTGEQDASLRRKWTVARWREAYQNDFAARMQWCLAPYNIANHNPVAVIGNDGSRNTIVKKAKPGQKISLNAGKSHDPDDNVLSYNWWLYHEVSDFGVEFAGNETPEVVVHVPVSAKRGDAHIILELTDNGSPRLTAYRRVIIRVE